MDVRTVNCSGGILTNIDDWYRPANKAKRIRNFHQLTRGVFSSGGGGWKRDNAAALNGGGSSVLDFGVYTDSAGNDFLLAQCGNTLYNYDTVGHAGTSISGMTALSATALPCMRPASPTAFTSNPFTVYCNGAQEPVKLFKATAGSAPDTAQTLGFRNGFATERATISGTITAGDTITIAISNGTGGILSTSPQNIVYKVVTGDTLASIAANIAQAVNANTVCSTATLTAISSGAVITFSWAVYQGAAAYTFAYVQGGNTEAIAFVAGTTAPTFPGIFNGLTYTKPSLCAPFQGRMAYAGFANSGASGNAVSNVVLISSLGDAEAFIQSTPSRATDAWSIPLPSALGLPTALVSFRPLTNNSSELLIVGCQKGMCIISGTDASSFNLQIQSTQFGVPSNRAFVQLDNTLLFLATDGLRQYNGANNITNLITESASLDFYDEFVKVDRSQWAVSHAVHHRDTQEVWFWVPYLGPDGTTASGDNGKPQHAFVLNYNTLDGQPIWYLVDNTVCMASVEFNHTFYGGNDVGAVQKWYGVDHYDDASGAGTPADIIPGSTITLAALGVGNPAQFCSINNVVVGTGSGNQKFLINAATYEIMDDGSTRKQAQQPFNYTLLSKQVGETVLGSVSGPEWTLNTSAFPSNHSSFISGYVPQGHGRLWEFELTCNDSSHNLDFTFLQATISIGGQRV